MNAELQNLAQGFSMLSDATRLGILKALGKGPKNASALCKTLSSNQPTASHHLGLLRMGRLVRSARQGKRVFYTIDDSGIGALASALSRLTGKRRK